MLESNLAAAPPPSAPPKRGGAAEEQGQRRPSSEAQAAKALAAEAAAAAEQQSLQCYLTAAKLDTASATAQTSWGTWLLRVEGDAEGALKKLSAALQADLTLTLTRTRTLTLACGVDREQAREQVGALRAQWRLARRRLGRALLGDRLWLGLGEG